MPTAFMLVNTEIKSESDVLTALKKVDGVQKVHTIYGVYDIIAKIEAYSIDELKEIVTWRIRRLHACTPVE